jgi:zinc protease
VHFWAKSLGKSLGLLLFLGWSLSLGEVPPIVPGRTGTPPVPVVTRLANGAELQVVRDARVPMVSLVIAVRGAGSAAAEPGLAAYTVDLMAAPPAAVVTLETLGGSFRAWVDEDGAYFALSTLAASFPASLRTLAPLLVAPAFAEPDAARIRADQVARARSRPDRAGAVSTLVLHRALHPGPFGEPAGGFAEEIARFDGARARAFHAARLRPDRAVIVIVGDVDATQARAEVERSLGAWAGHAAPVAATPFPPPQTGLLVIDLPLAERASLLLGARGVSRADPRAPAVEVLAMILGGSYGSLLNQRLREELRLTYGADAGSASFATTGRLTLATDVATRDAARARREITELLGRLGKRPLPAATVARAKSALVYSLPRMLASQMRLAETLAVLAVQGADPGWLAGYAAAIESVTAADVKRAARDLLDPRRLTTVLVGDLARIGLSGVRFTPEGLPAR